MRSGVSFPSYQGATMAMATGAASADYPVSALASAQSIRSVFRASAPGAIAVTFIFSAAKMMEFLGILHHNAPAGATFRWRLFSDANPDPVGNAAHQVWDSGVIAFYPPDAEVSSVYPAVRPYLLPSDRSVRSGRLDLSAHGAAWEIGALELAGWWGWEDVAVPREIGVKNSDVTSEQPNGGDHVMGKFAPRIFSGSRDSVEIQTERATALDFQRAKGTYQPFVWVWDYDDPETWAREVMVVRNSALTPLTQNDHPSGRIAFGFMEHLR